MNPQSVKCLTHSQQLPHVSLIKGCFASVLEVKGRLHKALGPISARQLCYMCMPMRPNKAETAVHGCHHLGQEHGLLTGWYGCAYARPWVGVWACHLLLLLEKSYLSCRLCQMCISSHNKNRMTHPLWVAKNCTTHPLPRVQKLMTQPLSAPAPHPPPPYFLTSPSLWTIEVPRQIRAAHHIIWVNKRQIEVLHSLQYCQSLSYISQRQISLTIGEGSWHEQAEFKAIF